MGKSGGCNLSKKYFQINHFSIYDIPKNDIMYIFLFFFNSKNITQIFNINADNMFFQDTEISGAKIKKIIYLIVNPRIHIFC